MKKSDRRFTTHNNSQEDTGRPGRQRNLTQREVRAAFETCPQFPPILSLDQAAKLAHLAPSTLKRLASEGFFTHSIRRGKPVAFWRDRFVVEVMELDQARKRRKNSRAQKNAPKGGDAK